MARVVITQSSQFQGKIAHHLSNFDVNTGLPSMDYPRIVFEWKVISQTGMQSVIEWKFYEDDGPHDFDILLNNNSVLILNGTKVWDLDSYNSKTSGTITVTRSPENNIGLFQVYMYTTGSYRKTSGGTTTWWGLTTDETYEIPSMTTAGEGAEITAISDFTDETSPVISYTYDRGTNVDSVTIELGIAFNGNNIVIPYREISAIENTYTLNFTQSDLNTLYTLLNDGETAALRFYLKTTEVVDGETLVILSDPFVKTFNFVNYKPKLTPTLTDLNDATYALTGNREHLVRYMSKVSYDMNVELRKGALDVIGCYIQNGGRIEEGFTSGTFDNPTTNVFYFSATDDRGYTGTASKSLSLFDGEFINYIKLSSSLKSTPISADGTISITITGKYFNANFGVAQNKLDMQYAIYKKGTAPSWNAVQTITPEMVDNETYTYTFSDSGLDYTAQYVVAVRINDLLMSSESSISVVAKPVFYWNNDEFIFNVPVKYSEGTADLVVEEKTVAGYYMNSSGQYTSGGYSWTYRKWSSGLLECWCAIPISTTVNTAWGNMYVAAVSNIYKTDLSYPVQPTATPVITVTLGAGGTKGMLIADNSYAADNVSTGRYNIASPVSISSNTTFRLNYYVRGKWK